jgi:serine/threonine protein kinase
MAPETITTGQFTKKSDVWAFGITLIEVVTRSTPWDVSDDDGDDDDGCRVVSLILLFSFPFIRVLNRVTLRIALVLLFKVIRFLKELLSHWVQ